MIQYFETHAHYDDRRFDADRDELLDALPCSGITRCVNVGAGMATARASVELAEQYPWMLASVGVHPHNAKELRTHDIDELAALAAHE